MAAWGAYDAELDGKWSDDLYTAGLMSYPMAAFAKRVAANPSAFSASYQQDAVRFTTAVMWTYYSFRTEMHLSSSDSHAYHFSPTAYSTLVCSNPQTQSTCLHYKGDAGHPESWNENSILMRTLAEASSAANSDLYRNSTDPYKNTTIFYLTVEAPDLMAKWVQFFDDYLNSGDRLRYWSGDNAAYYVWKKKSDPATAGGQEIENTPHAQITIASLAVIYEDKAALDALLAAAGYSETVNVTPEILERFAVDFLRLIWNTDNTVGDLVDGTADGTPGDNYNQEVGGYVMLSPIDPWVWVRSHDSLAASVGFGYTKWREDNWAALIRYQ